MRKIIGIGETILDILFSDNKPFAAVPGGSSFNAMVSLGRLNVPAIFVGETGDDKVGHLIRSFMQENKLSVDYLDLNSDLKSAVSLAFLNEKSDAEYVFFKDYPSTRFENAFPKIEADDIVLFGSYYALNPVLRPRMLDFLDMAKKSGAIIYYDINFRKTHEDEVVRLSTTFIENFEYADIIRGSNEDFQYLYRMTDPEKIYREKICYYTPYFIHTAAECGARVWGNNFYKHYEAKSIVPLSTVGAGDNFNAGFLFGLLNARIRKSDLPTLKEKEWDAIVKCGLDFAAEVCQTHDNYISNEFAASYSI